MSSLLFHYLLLNPIMDYKYHARNDLKDISYYYSYCFTSGFIFLQYHIKEIPLCFFAAQFQLNTQISIVQFGCYYNYFYYCCRQKIFKLHFKSMFIQCQITLANLHSHKHSQFFEMKIIVNVSFYRDLHYQLNFFTEFIRNHQYRYFLAFLLS